MARTTIKEFPFVSGQNEAIDAKVLPDGLLTRAKNVRLRKDARWGVRADFDAIGNDADGGSGNFIPRDLVGFGDGICSLGAVASTQAPMRDLFNYGATAPREWSSSAGNAFFGTRMGGVTNLRMLAAYSSTSISAPTFSVTRVDCAAAGGVVCLAYETSSTASKFRFLQAATGATIYEAPISGGRPRVASVGTKFFFTTKDLELYSFDPATDSSETDLGLAFGSTPVCFDFVANRAGTGTWLVVNTSAPATAIRPFNASGTAGSDIVGPAVAYAHVAVRETATRLHLVSVTAAAVCQLRTYTLAGALSAGPTTVTSVAARQPGLLDATDGGVESIGVYVERTGSPNDFAFTRYNLVHGTITGLTFDDARLATKPHFSATGTTNRPVVGLTLADGAFFSSALSGADDTNEDLVDVFTNKFAASSPAVDHTPQIARDASTGKYYWPTLLLNDSVARPLLYEFDYLSSARRQSAQMAGVLYIGGGNISVYDTKTLAPASFFEKPRFLTVAATTGGSLPVSSTLLLSLVFETRDSLGNIIQSDVGAVETVSLNSTQNAISVTFPLLHGTRATGGDVIAVVYRSISGISQLRRAESSTSSPITLTTGDSAVRADDVIYTQSSRGALSGTTPQEAPLPTDFLWKFGARLIAASADQAFVSREIFPGEEVTWSGSVGFTIPKISERITGIAALDQRGLIFTSDHIYAFSGEGPNDLGEGRFSEPLPIPTSTGLNDWRSLVETPLGLFFQGSNGQLWLLPRDSSPPSWIGQPVRDTLVAYPVVTSATLVTEEQLVSFTCNNSGGTDGRIVSYDLRANTWIVDEFPSSTPLAAGCSYQQRLAILSAGVVYTEKTTLTPNTFIEHGLTTGDIKPFGGTGWGKICSVDLVGEYRGDCDLYLRVSYDSGKSFTTLTKIHQLRSTSYAAGDIVRVSWDPLRRKAERIRLEFTAKTPGSATEGFVFNGYSLELLGDVRGASRKAAAQRG